MLSYIEILYLKKFLKKTLLFFIMLGLFGLLLYSCDYDFPIRQKYLPQDDTIYQEGFIQNPIQSQQSPYATEFGTEIVSEVQITGKLISANPDSLRTTCPFQKNTVELYNRYFWAVLLSINNKEIPFATIPQTRIIKQFISKLSNDMDFWQKYSRHQVTLFGYGLYLRSAPQNKWPHIIITKMIIDGQVYE